MMQVDVALRGGIPRNMADMLDYLTGQRLSAPPRLPDHPLFTDPASSAFLEDASGTFAHAPDRIALVLRLPHASQGERADQFLNWLRPYMLISPGTQIGTIDSKPIIYST